MAKDRFDLEGAIMACWTTADDLDLLAQQFVENPPSCDELANVLIGLSRLHAYRAAHLFDIFEQLVEAGEFRTPREDWPEEPAAADVV